MVVTKGTKVPNEGEFTQAAMSLLLGYYGFHIATCKRCQWPVMRGMRCHTCGSCSPTSRLTTVEKMLLDKEVAYDDENEITLTSKKYKKFQMTIDTSKTSEPEAVEVYTVEYNVDGGTVKETKSVIEFDEWINEFFEITPDKKADYWFKCER